MTNVFLRAKAKLKIFAKKKIRSRHVKKSNFSKRFRTMSIKYDFFLCAFWYLVEMRAKSV